MLSSNLAPLPSLPHPSRTAHNIYRCHLFFFFLLTCRCEWLQCTLHVTCFRIHCVFFGFPSVHNMKLALGFVIRSYNAEFLCIYIHLNACFVFVRHAQHISYFSVAVCCVLCVLFHCSCSSFHSCRCKILRRPIFCCCYFFSCIRVLTNIFSVVICKSSGSTYPIECLMSHIECTK